LELYSHSISFLFKKNDKILNNKKDANKFRFEYFYKAPALLGLKIRLNLSVFASGLFCTPEIR
jgi:hypothetical protein